MGIQKRVLIILLIACLLSGFMTTEVSARIEGSWALQVGDVLTGEDISIQHPTAAIFHQQTVNTTDLEQYDMSFPVFSPAIGLGPVAINTGTGIGSGGTGIGIGAQGTSNIVPFGPVNLAFPSINEDVTQTVSSNSVGFFKANWAYMTDMASGNLGAAPLGVSFTGLQPFKSTKMLGSNYIWPSMTQVSAGATLSPTVDTHRMKLSNDLFNTTGGMASPAPTNATVLNGPSSPNATSNITAPELLPTANTTGGTTGVNTSNLALPQGWGLRKPAIDPKSTAAQIKAMPMMDRLYHNAFVGSTMYKAYEGPTQYPEWIDPYDNGKGVFNQISLSTILGVALHETQPGVHLAPVFWSL